MKKFDIFRILFSTLYRAEKLPHSSAFYFSRPEKRRRMKIIQNLNKMIHADMESYNNEDFNQFILAQKEDKKDGKN